VGVERVRRALGAAEPARDLRRDVDNILVREAAIDALCLLARETLEKLGAGLTVVQPDRLVAVIRVVDVEAGPDVRAAIVAADEVVQALDIPVPDDKVDVERVVPVGWGKRMEWYVR
jgi:hypothetical protein